MDTLLSDLRYGLRTLLKSPGFTAAALLTLVLGIGANSAIFSVVNAVLLRPLPFGEPERIVRLSGYYTTRDLPPLDASEGELLDYAGQTGTFDAVGGYVQVNANLTGDGEPERVAAVYATGGFFRALGVPAVLGRTFGPEEDRPDAEPVAVLSHGLWQRRFGSDPGIVGKSIAVNLRPVTVMGVMPPGFRFPGETELWAPRGLDPAQLAPRGQRYLGVIARLAPGVSPEQARASTEALSRRFVEQFPDLYPPDSGWGIRLVPLQEDLVGDTGRYLVILLAAVGLVLLIACVNVVNLLLVRAQTREREVSIRVTLGASRGRLLWQSMAEGLVLALTGGLLGLLLAHWSLAAFLAVDPDPVPRAGEIGLDGRVVSFTLGLSLLTGILVGLVPALRASRPDLQAALKEGGKGTAGGSQRFRRLLVGLEVALSLVLLIAAGLMIKSFSQMREIGTGFRAGGLLTAELALPRSKYPEDRQITQFHDQLLERLQALPGVQSASMVSLLPLSGERKSSGGVNVEGRPFTPGQPAAEPELRSIDHRYFRTLGVPLVAGRELAALDHDQALPVTVIDRTLARQLWPGESPLGKRLKQGPPTEENPNPWLTVVGVVGDVKQLGLTGDSRGTLYYPQLQRLDRTQFLLLRSRDADPLSLAGTLREQVRQMDPDIPLSSIETMDQRLSALLSKPRFSMLLLAAFAAVALVLAAVGIYGVVAYSVSQRTREIGLRMALGAGRREVLRLVVGQGMGVVLAGVLAGLLLAWWATRALTGLLYGVAATDLATFIGVPMLLCAVALAANLVPARRAARLEPTVALRYD